MQISENKEFGRDILSYYGTCISQYSGQGILTISGGDKLNCKFIAGQLNNGDTIILCHFNAFRIFTDHTESSFEGTTLEGYKLMANKAANTINYLPEVPRGQSGTWESILWRYISVQMIEGGKPNKISFGLTNFEFSGMEHDIITNGFNRSPRNFWILPININNINFFIKKLRDYDKITARISTLKNVDVTCEIETVISSDSEIENLKEMIDNICYILSIARGTKVQWIYCNIYDKEGKIISKTHFSRITKPYCPLPIIDPSINGRNETKNFIEIAYPTYIKKRDLYNLNKGIIDSYLAGKAEEDFLQPRGVKLAVAIEMFKNAFLSTHGSSIKEYIIDEERFSEYLPKLCKGIREALSEKIEKTTLDKLCCDSNQQRLACINRISFRKIVSKLCKSVHLKINDKDIDLFINCRNSLVHTGRFYCETATDKQKSYCKPLKSPEYEYFFLVDFLDKIFLKFFNYSGDYMSSRDLKFQRNKLN